MYIYNHNQVNACEPTIQVQKQYVIVMPTFPAGPSPPRGQPPFLLIPFLFWSVFNTETYVPNKSLSRLAQD